MRLAHDVRTAPGMVAQKDSEDDDSFDHGFVLNGGANAGEPHSDKSEDEARASDEPALEHRVKMAGVGEGSGRCQGRGRWQHRNLGCWAASCRKCGTRVTSAHRLLTKACSEQWITRHTDSGRPARGLTSNR